MRDPARIKPFLNALAAKWRENPDWRFGQLIENLMKNDTRHLFFIEDEDFLKLINKK